MSSVECLRELINERLTAAAEEIFRVFQETISEYEKEINRQRILLDFVWKPEIRLHRVELPQQHVCNEEEVLADQQLCNLEKNSSLDQEDPEPPQIKEEQEELCTSLDQEDPEPPQIKEEQKELCTSLDQEDPEPPQIKEEQKELCTSLNQEDPEPPQIKEEQEELCSSLEGEQLVLKQETETFMLTPTCEESEDQTLDLSPDETQREAEKEHVVSMSVKSSVQPEPNSDNQLLSHNSDVAESQDHKGGKHGDSGSTRKAEPKLKKRPYRRKNHTNNEDNSTKLKIQSNTDTGKKSFKCGICGKSFKIKSKLQIHMRVHTGEKPYSCNNCEKRFARSHGLRLHMRVHTGEKPYSCDTCGKRFGDMTTVKRHMRVHTGEKPYTCKTCEKGFTEMSKLKLHMRIHTGEKPHSCNTCGKRFRNMATMKRHMRVHTGARLYNCTTCGKEYRRRHNFKDHMRKHAVEEGSG